MVLKGVIFCCDLLPCWFNGPVCRDIDRALLVIFPESKKTDCSTFYDLIIITRWILGPVNMQQISLMQRTLFF